MVQSLLLLSMIIISQADVGDQHRIEGEKQVKTTIIKTCYLGEKNSVQTLGYGLSNIKQHPEKEKQVCMYLQRLVCVGVSEFPSSPLPRKSLSLSKVH